MSAQQPHQLCPSAIYLHNQRHQYQHPVQHFQGPCSSSAVAIPGHPQNRFIGHIPLQQQHFSAVHQQHQQHYGPQQYQQTTASLPGSNGGQHAQQGWNPYLATHPGQSHISSTPDSGIQSIDGHLHPPVNTLIIQLLFLQVPRPRCTHRPWYRHTHRKCVPVNLSAPVPTMAIAMAH